VTPPPPSIPDLPHRVPTLTQITVRIVGLVFVTEFGVMIALHRLFAVHDRTLDALVDSSLLVVAVAPFVVSLFRQRRRAEQQREAVIQQLRHALAEVKTLSGLLPICANCKQVRDDRGYWNKLEVYVRDHSDAEFSHGICPVCSHKLYGAYADEVSGSVD
jgi:hypothetical protein